VFALFPNEFLEQSGAFSPVLQLLLFLAASALIVWRLELMADRGVEGTVLGTIVMPYCSGLGNLVFALILATQGGRGEEVITNCMVNNVTNLTLLIGLPALIWGLSLVSKKRMQKKDKMQLRINRLSLLLSLTAGLFFCGILWALSIDGSLSRGDGIVLIGLFLFWQCFQVYDVLKTGIKQQRSTDWMLVLDFALILLGGWFVFTSISWLTDWISAMDSGFISADKLGLLSGWLMVIPNAALALFYAWRRRADVVFSSQLGDGHICIPLCIGLFALFSTSNIPSTMVTGLWIILGFSLLHALLLLTWKGVPRWIGGTMAIAYVVFLALGWVG